ncbi:hypothetical protein HNQ44_000058 [Planomicrobium koreense]|jgi:hypothetical protein|uniref:Uncharacterized protein n=1 Tax=Planococcus koreensis TaxID=112331 RepID=A0A7W8CNM8_9BACL|nr:MULTISPECIES: hypothetical protein [Planococcus]MBB5178636.1 hypothetical protein [Planococcus koreensis]MDN3450928.1 hypothetical protein [Planococcus sp. APC 3906]
MEPRRIRKSDKTTNELHSSGLSLGVAQMDVKKLDRKPSVIWDFLTQSFLFLLGGVILCALLYGLIYFT